MVVAAFDTLKFANALKAAGVPDKQAEAHAAAFAELVQVNFKELVTKDDLAAAVQDLKRDNAELRTELKRDNAELRTELKHEITELRTELKRDNAELRAELKHELATLRTACRRHESGWEKS